MPFVSFFLNAVVSFRQNILRYSKNFLFKRWDGPSSRATFKAAKSTQGSRVDCWLSHTISYEGAWFCSSRSYFACYVEVCQVVATKNHRSVLEVIGDVMACLWKFVFGISTRSASPKTSIKTASSPQQALSRLGLHLKGSLHFNPSHRDW